MKKEIITSPTIAPSFTYTTCHAVRAGNFVFVTGQLGNPPGIDPKKDPQRVAELGTLEEQVVGALENVKAILEKAGTSLDNVVKRNIYITHAGDFETVYGVMERYFPSPVASTGVVTGLIPKSGRVEIDVIAIIPD